MTATSQSYTVRLSKQGQLTIPQQVCDKLAISEGELLTLIQIDDLVFLTPRQVRLPALAENFTAEMESANVSLADLLQGLTEEQEAIYQEQRGRGTE